MGCSPAHHPYLPPYTQDPASGFPPPVAPLCWSLFEEGKWGDLRPVRYLSLHIPRASVSSPPLCACAASLPSLSLYPPCVFPVSSAAIPVGSGVRRWHTAPEIGRTRRCHRPCGILIVWAYPLTWACICNMCRMPDKPIILVPWCEPPAPSLPPPPSILIHRLVGPFWPSLSLTPFIARGVSLTSLLIPAVYVDAHTNSRRAVFSHNFRWFCLHPPPPFVEGGGDNLVIFPSRHFDYLTNQGPLAFI